MRDRLTAILRLDLAYNLKRPMMWILLLIVTSLTWGLSTGSMQVSSGASTVGGTKAWITSEFSAAFYITMLVSTLYSFFASIAAGLAVIKDDEEKVSELLHASRLRVGEYIWGKGLALLLAFITVLAVQIVLMMVCFHLLPSAAADKIRGPFQAANYLRPAVVFGLPALTFFIGVTFYLGVRLRRAVVAFLFPVVMTVICGFFLWNWTPDWLDPTINRLLMAIDPTGVRWINETWLKLDRGADFYNTTPIGFDLPFALSRLAFFLLGLGAIHLAVGRLYRTLRGTKPVAAAKRPRRRSRRQQTASVLPLTGAALSMRTTPPRPLQAVLDFARAEVACLWREPGLYLFLFIIFAQTLSNALLTLGPFQTRLLLTPGQLAVSSFNTLAFLVCLLLMFFLVESLERERTDRVEGMVYSAPLNTAWLLLGKIVGNSVVAIFVLVGTLVGGWIAILIQGQVPFTLWPFLLVWGPLLFPTFLAWSAFMAAVYAISGNRYVSYAVGLGVVSYTLYRQLSSSMAWPFNWWMWGGLRWSDMSLFELDRQAIVLNRLLALALAFFCLVLAVRFFRRRQPDAAGIVHRLRPRPFLRSALRLAVAALPVMVCGFALWLMVFTGPGGEAAEMDAEDYWRQNLETWQEAPLPAMDAVDIDLEIDPEAGSLASQGTFTLRNPHDDPMRRFVLTGGRHWRDLTWTLGGAPYEPEDRSLLYVFTPETPLPPGGTLQVGFAFNGHYPDGNSKNGGGAGQFILPSGVVLTSFTPSFAPVVGFMEGVGVDDDNRTDPPDYADDIHEQTLRPAFGAVTPFTTRLRITAPEDFTMNGVGVLAHEEVVDGQRTVEWVSDAPVRFYNVVGGRWQVRKGEGTAIYYHDAHAYNLEAMASALDGARRWYSEWFYPYPWRELKLSEFPDLATYAQGHPTNITFSEGIGFLTMSDPRTNLVEMVTAHEAAHQWWGNLLTPGYGPGGNILSEGMSHFSTAMLLEKLIGPRGRMAFMKRIEERYGSRRRADDERPLVKIDGRNRGDTTVTYDKGGWVAWMLMQHMGRDAMLVGLRDFIGRYKDGPDYPLLEDMTDTLRLHAADPEAFDRFVDQWFHQVLLPEYELTEARTEARGSGWLTTLRIENVGSGTMPVEVAVVRGERFTEEGESAADYRDARTTVTLTASAVREVAIRSDFEPERVVIDPDVQVLQLRRNVAVAEL